jgi:bifunctional pyridoxal-dependent enzyme with beta-cystathionase and maltose regulon repressor activities
MIDGELFFDEGYIFGPEGAGFERMNLACPTWVLQRALEKLETVVRRVRQ